jgi:PIN domain nuclease of toxin-antitoxin system
MTGPAENLVVSMVSMWEITIKLASGKLSSMGGSIRDVSSVLAERGVELLPILPSHLFRLETLPMLHRDPFDRLLVAQAMEEGLPILTNDALIRRYAVKVVW